MKFVITIDCIEESANSDMMFTFGQLLEFGAHSRALIQYLFQNGKDELVRDNLAQLVQNGMSIQHLRDAEEESMENRSPEEAEAIVSFYIENMVALSNRKDEMEEDRDPFNFCVSLIRHIDNRDSFFLRAAQKAAETGLMDPFSCAEEYYVLGAVEAGSVEADIREDLRDGEDVSFVYQIYDLHFRQEGEDTGDDYYFDDDDDDEDDEDIRHYY